MDKALRRHHEQRVKERARERLGQWSDWSDGRYTYDERLVGIHAETPAPCSCPGCGNPRRHFGQQTRQEQIADDREQAQIEDWLYTTVDGKTEVLSTLLG